MEWIIIVVLAIVFAITAFILYKRAYKLGMKDLLSLFLVSGYEMKVKAFKVQNQFVKKGGIVFVGDSITQDYQVHDYYPDLHVYNRGIGGDTTAGLLERLDVSIFDLEPKTIVLLIGTNDFGVLEARPAAIFERIEAIIGTIRKRLPEADILLSSVYPVNEAVDAKTVSARNNANIKALNQLLQGIKGVTYVNLSDVLADDDGNLKASYTHDGLHVNAEGYQAVTEVLRPYLH